MDPIIQQRIQTAGYRIDGDSLLIELTPTVQVRAKGLSYLLTACAEQKIDPLRVLGIVMESVRKQPTVQAAMKSPGTAKCNINVALKDIQLQQKPQA